MQFSIKYRPRSFSEVIGQPVSVRILVNSILMGRVPGAVLFAGIRGTGKTTLARLYARALNCDSFMQAGDVCGVCSSCRELYDSHQSILERDAATYNGVDDVRELEGLLKQVIVHRYRVIIFDECHMLSKGAQAALLKLVEEPPRNTVFLLVTTDPQKLSDTLRSRCLSMPLRSFTSSEVAEGVRRILQTEGKSHTEEFVERLSLLGGGSLRDTQQILESLVIASGDGPLDVNLLKEAVGVVSREEFGDMAEVLDQKNLRVFMEEIRSWNSEGRDLRTLFLDGIPTLLHDFMLYLSGIPADTGAYKTGLPYESLSCNLRLGLDDVRYLVREWEETSQLMRYAPDPKVVWSMFAAKVCSVAK